MKLLTVITKNFKLLIRSKASAFTVLVGPLLIILLVGFAFSTKTSYELSIGYYAPAKNNLTASFVDTLKQSQYDVQEFTDEQSCVKRIEQGIIHTCIIFPENLQVSNEQKSEIRFLVDYSRINLVYKVIGSVSDILDIESEEVSYSLTQTLLSRINNTVKDLKQQISTVDGFNSKLSLLALDLQSSKANSEALKFESGSLNLGNVENSIASLNESVTELIEKGNSLINDSDEWLDDLGSYENVSDARDEFDKLREELLKLYNTTPLRINDLERSINVINSSLSQLEKDLGQNKQLNQEIQQKLASAKNSLASVQASVLDLKKALEKTKQNLESIGITKAETIVSPVNTRIEPVVSESSKLTFTFPFLLVLVIMFVALLLSSNIVIFEKSSKSFFRNHVTPTRQEFFVITTFITSLIVILVQTIIILSLANYFMHIPLFKNALCASLLIFFTSAFFIMLGMAIGYIFSTQEGAIMASIIAGSVFLFLSNLVIPLESFAPWITSLMRYNPYVLASELLRKLLLFNVSVKESYFTLLLLGGAALLIFILIIISVGLRNKKRIKAFKELGLFAGLPAEKESLQPTSEALVVGDRTASDKEGLLKLVSDMTKAEFEDVVSSQENKIADWVEKALCDKKLASKLRKTSSRKEMISLISEDIKSDEEKEEPE